MSIYFFDSSAVVKRYADESGSKWVCDLCSARDVDSGELIHDISLGEITRVEVASALFGKAKRGKEINQQDAETAYELFLSHLEDEYRIVLLTSPLITSAAQLARKHALRAYDAVQLAFAVYANGLLRQEGLVLIFVSSDQTLVQVAQAEGLVTENPADHDTSQRIANRSA